ncbi:unnamed protein product, partial [Prorocentrum cordatum]
DLHTQWHQPDELRALDAAVLSRAAAVSDFFNGSWEEAELQHYCRGVDCCSSREVSVQKAKSIVSALFDEFLVSSGIAANRWKSLSTATTNFSILMGLHRILPQAFAASLGTPLNLVEVRRQLVEQGVGDDDAVTRADSWIIRMGKRTLKANAFFQEGLSSAKTLIANCMTLPADRLFHSIFEAESLENPSEDKRMFLAHGMVRPGDDGICTALHASLGKSLAIGSDARVICSSMRCGWSH